MVPDMLDVLIMASGYTTAHRRVEDPAGPSGSRRFDATWLAIRHPTLGVVLFDTGYSEHVAAAAATFPDRIHLWVTPMYLRPEEAATARLAAVGIDAAEVRHVIISHFHVDHIGGIRDFPQATFYATAAAFDQAQRLRGLAAVRRGILRGLLPDDFDQRVRLLEDCCTMRRDPSSGLVMYHDMLGQQDFVPVLLPGHARGMVGLLVPSHNLLFAADASWSGDTFQRGVLPRQVVRLFFDSWSAFIDTQQKLRLFSAAHPQVEILFTHCPETMRRTAHA
ncbi:MAG: MBL fold metallo-hydrolase [Candidatus Kapabacteria bacterium]|nr:MBL fold metallo-hydrolase [Candidatus Kapabacteria bacterium]